jgi:hypothetical protein
MVKRDSPVLPDEPCRKSPIRRRNGFSRAIIKAVAIALLWLSFLGLCLFVYDHFSKYVR